MKTHVYSLVLGLVFTLFCISLNAQNYQYIPLVKPGLQLWTCDQGYRAHDDEEYRFKRYALTNEDTIIENQTYKKLYSFTNIEFDSTTATCIGGIRENEQKQVFFRGGLINKMFYDFSLSIGDTFYDSDNSDFIFKVENIDTLNYNGIQRRVFTIEAYYIGIKRKELPIKTFGQIAAIWIEGIGNFEGLLYPFHTSTAENWGNTRCYSYNGDLLYSNLDNGANDCTTPLLGLDNISFEDNSITLYPNPANSEINIQSDNKINSIEIFNSLGQKVYQEKTKSKERKIDINSLAKGVYIIGANTEKGYIKKKLIKN